MEKEARCNTSRHESHDPFETFFRHPFKAALPSSSLVLPPIAEACTRVVYLVPMSK